VGAGVARQGIVDGQREHGFPAVGALLLGEGESLQLCTGTVISPRVVLTAAHCLEHTPDGKGLFLLGDDISSPAQSISFSSAVIRPEYEKIEISPTAIPGCPARREDELVLNISDVALVLLDEPVAMEPMMVRHDSLDGMENARVTLIGFGNSGSLFGLGYGAGPKRSGQATIGGMLPDLLFIYRHGHRQGTICGGDSGGPMLLSTEEGMRIIGVASRGDCDEVGVFTRTDSLGDWIETTVAALEPEIAEPEPGEPEEEPEDPAAQEKPAEDSAVGCMIASPRRKSSGPATWTATTMVVLLWGLRQARRARRPGR
jgi:hypothetical protein